MRAHVCAGSAVPDVMAAVLAAGEQHRRRVSTATLNLVIKEATAWKSPPSQRGSMRKGRIYYATQAGEMATGTGDPNDPLVSAIFEISCCMFSCLNWIHRFL